MYIYTCVSDIVTTHNYISKTVKGQKVAIGFQKCVLSNCKSHLYVFSMHCKVLMARRPKQSVLWYCTHVDGRATEPTEGAQAQCT